MEETNQVWRTHEAIRQALLDCLKDQEITKIKASEVIAKARVSKATFYRYYRDTYDVLVDCFSTYLDIQDETHERAAEQELPQSCYELILKGACKISAYPKLYLLCIKCSYNPFVLDFYKRSISRSIEVTRELIAQLGVTKETCLIDPDHLAQLCVNISTDINVTWAQDGCKETPEEIARTETLCISRFILSMSSTGLSTEALQVLDSLAI